MKRYFLKIRKNDRYFTRVTRRFFFEFLDHVYNTWEFKQENNTEFFYKNNELIAFSENYLTI